jgi:hypothetical protein
MTVDDGRHSVQLAMMSDGTVEITARGLQWDTRRVSMPYPSMAIYHR